MYRLILSSTLVGCLGSEEAPKVSLPINTAASAIGSVTTDLGYDVQVSHIRIAVSTVQFTIEGEMHSDVASKQTSSVAPPPPPHPGHSAGGEVTGELLGDYVLVWNGQPQLDLGVATLVVGEYLGANFTYRAAGTDDGLAVGDPLLGHTFDLVGTIAKQGTTKPFHAVLDVEPDSAMIGAVFESVITETSTATLTLVFDPMDTEGDTAFDGIDFFELPETSGALEITPGSAAHNILRRTIQTHDHYAVVSQ